MEVECVEGSLLRVCSLDAIDGGEAEMEMGSDVDVGDVVAQSQVTARWACLDSEDLPRRGRADHEVPRECVAEAHVGPGAESLAERWPVERIADV